jgi:hypothetical protein
MDTERDRWRMIGIGTPRGLQGRVAAILVTVLTFIHVVQHWFVAIARSSRLFAATRERRTVAPDAAGSNPVTHRIPRRCIDFVTVSRHAAHLRSASGLESRHSPRFIN